MVCQPALLERTGIELKNILRREGESGILVSDKLGNSNSKPNHIFLHAGDK